MNCLTFMDRFERWRDPSHVRAAAAFGMAIDVRRQLPAGDYTDPLTKKVYPYKGMDRADATPPGKADALRSVYFVVQST